MTTKLEYLAFLVTFVAFLEQRVNQLSWRLYNGGVRKRLPTTCTAVVSKFEDFASNTYSTARTWVCEKGEATLVAVDTRVGPFSPTLSPKACCQVGDAVEWVESYIPTCTCGGRVTAVRNFWTAIAARISETWKNHGIIVGTLVVLVALFYTFLSILNRIIHSPMVQSILEAVQASLPIKIAKSYYSATIQPLVTQLTETITEAVQRTSAAMSGPMESVTEYLSGSIDTMVGTVYYAKLFDGTAAAMTKLSSTGMYSKLVEKVEPFVGPSWETFSHSSFYLNLVDKFTPIKKE